MAKCYFELRNQPAKGTESIAADIMRHLYARQHLGKTVVICEQTVGMMSACRRQWLKLGRIIQKKRAATLNADKILKYTHGITRMQQMRFTHRPALEDPDAEVYFLTPEQCDVMPLHCYTIYTIRSVPEPYTQQIITQLPVESLIVDYTHLNPWARFGLQSKTVLEEQVNQEWQHMQQFLQSHHIDAHTLITNDLHNIEAMDDALDTLLSTSHRFMRIATEFQRALELSRPLRIKHETREAYDALILLAHRVQALSPNAFTQHFLEVYNEDDTILDHLRWLLSGGVQTIDKQRAAGRARLAQALQQAQLLQGEQRVLYGAIF